MSAKSVIQKLEDSELIRLFLEFVQNYHLQYEKTSKQISYKCYEATWILVNFKANGYGRTQSQAYKHALRNLLQILIQEPEYTQFFVQTLTVCNYNNRPSIKKTPLNQSNQNYAKRIISSKTQGHQPIEKQNKIKGQIPSKLYQSYSKVNQRSQSKLGAKFEANFQTKNKDCSQIYQTIKDQNNKKQSCQISMVQSINQNKYQEKCSNKKFEKNSNESTQQLSKALLKLSQLEEYLLSINKQNQSLKTQLNSLNQISRQAQKQNSSPHRQIQQSYKHAEIINQVDFSTFAKNKPMIPKLKLQILPNYHKKSEKSLNQSLMAAYNEKREPSVKKLIC